MHDDVWNAYMVHVAEHQDIKCVQGCTGMHGGTWVSTWVMHNARGAHGGPPINEAQMCGGVRSYQVLSKVQGEAGYACGRMKCGRGCMEVHGANSAGSAGHACTTLSVAELPIHARVSYHA